jgi:hypothetical protein
VCRHCRAAYDDDDDGDDRFYWDDVAEVWRRLRVVRVNSEPL